MCKRKLVFLLLTAIVLPVLTYAQDDGSLAGDIKSLHSVLDKLYETLMPKCKQLIGIGQGIAGFAALWYIAYRVWGHLARAEPIDFYPLLKPFCIGFCVLNFSLVLAVINGVMKPTVSGTAELVENADATVATLLKQKEEAVKNSPIWQMYVGETGEGDREKWYKYTHDNRSSSEETWLSSIGNDVKFAFAKASYNFRNAIKEVIAEVLQILFAAVSLCINTLRTFNMVILALLGPLVFGISVFDMFSHTLKHWLARYLNVFLWLPICNIFGYVIATIQVEMLKIDIGQIADTGDTFFSRTDMGYMIFLIIGIFGYTTVPSIANHIIWVAGGDALTGKMTAASTSAVGMAASGAMMAGGFAAQVGDGIITGAGQLLGGDQYSVAAGLKNMASAPGNIKEGYNEKSTGQGLAADAGRSYGHLRDKLSGNSS